MRVTRQIVCFLCLTLLTSVSWSAPPEMEAKLQELIQEILKNEGLYPSLKLELTRSHTDEQAWLSIPGKERIERVAKISLVTQGKQFREQIQEEGEYAVITVGLGRPSAKQSNPNRVKTGTEIWIEVSNGKVCRILNESLFPAEIEPRILNGQITDRVPPLPNLARPHMFLSTGSTGAPLSVSLRGDDVARADQGISSDKNREQPLIRVLDTVEFQGHPCIRVRRETSHVRREYWLAEDRNLIPVRILSFGDRGTEFLPSSEAVVEDWWELQPGIWYPRRATIKRFKTSRFRREEKPVLAWRMDFAVQSAELNPKVEASLISQLDFPPGTSVSVWEDGKQVRTYEQGK